MKKRRKARGTFLNKIESFINTTINSYIEKQTTNKREKMKSKPKKSRKKSLIRKDKYDVKQDKIKVSSDKIKVNDIIYTLTKDAVNKRGSALILDTKDLITKKHLIKAGIKSNRIDIPNPYEHKEIRKKHRQTYDLLLGDFLEDIKEVGKESYSVAVFDYCCSIYGNKDINPEEDIKKYFGFNLPMDKSIFTYTFGKRAPEQGYGVNNNVAKADNIVCEAARQNGYVAVKLPVGYNYGSVFWNAFMIHKI